MQFQTLNSEMEWKSSQNYLKVLNITVSDLKYINNSKTFLIKSAKKNRDKLKNIKNLGNIKCHIVDCVNKNSTKGIVHHPSFEDTNDQELLNDLQEDNENILSVHIFNRKINGISVNSQTALITFDSTELPKEIKYLSFNILIIIYSSAVLFSCASREN